jgi:hypothetical protein
MLDINPHLSELVIAVVTEGAPRRHDLDLGFGFRMSLHVLRRGLSGQHDLQRVRGRTVPLAADLAAADVRLPSATTVGVWISKGRRSVAEREMLPSVINVDHRPRLVLPVPSDRVAALLVDGDYPIVGPLAAMWRPAANGQKAAMSPLPSPWDPTAAAGPQLSALRVEEHPQALGDLDLASVLSGADLVVGATDDMNEQALLAHHAYAAEIPK